MKDRGIIGIALINFLLFVGKISIGLISHSIALISDAINSFTDTVNTLVVLWATKIAREEADEEHQAGHGRAQPLAAFFVAIMTGVLAFEIIKEAILKLFSPQAIEHELSAIGILAITVFVKGALSIYEYLKGKKENNKALLAMSTESRGDVFISLGAILAIVLSVYLGIVWADPVIAIIIGMYVFYTGVEIAKENIDLLMGAAAKPEDLQKIEKALQSFQEIRAYHDLRTQHLGEKLQVTVHCVIEGEYSLKEWHDLEAAIAKKIEQIEIVDHAFVHMDPVDDSYSK